VSELLEITRFGRVLRIALNRPEKRNALSTDLCRALVTAFDEAAHDPDAGAILLTGNGKSFCAGMDLSEIGTTASAELVSLHERLFTLGARIEKPVLGAVSGPALAGGMGLVANCHIVVASEDATFGLTEIRIGLWPFIVYRAVSAALGDRRTAELALTGRVFGAREAKEMGLIHEISYDLEESAADLARSVAGFSPSAVRAGLRFVRDTRGRDWESAGQIAGRMRNEVFASEDFQEGLRAFREKRSPRWPSLEK
jgi:enoyl-CoA hydratase/carnithine racemase